MEAVAPMDLPAAPSTVLPDLLVPGLRIVFCGTAAGAASAALGAYYAGRGNRFWPILAETGLTPRLLKPEEFPLLPSFGIGLTDLAKHASGADADLAREAFDRAGLIRRIAAVAPGALAFNGKRAAAEFYGLPTARIAFGAAPPVDGMPPIFVLPSTSRAANGNWDAAVWHAFAERTPA
jgi:double-stranded uracil-DNA glycosylase